MIYVHGVGREGKNGPDLAGIGRYPRHSGDGFVGRQRDEPCFWKDFDQESNTM